MPSHPPRCPAWAAVLFASMLVLPAHAQVTTDRGASILIFPRVVADATTDTVLQVANLSDNRIAAFCAYVNGAAPGWQSLGFMFELDPQRPLYWTAARGRSATLGSETVDIPAAPAEFRGELLCVQVDASGATFGGNELAGQATTTDLTTGDSTSYTAVGLRGSGFNDGDGFLCIGNATTDTCFIGEYDPCPAEWLVNLPADGAADDQLGTGSQLSGRLAIAPCSQNLRDSEPGAVDIDLTVFNELAQRFTGQTSVTCWADLSLADIGGQIFARGMLGTDHAEARLTPAGDSGGFVVSVQTTRSTSDTPALVSSTAMTPQRRGAATASDLIVLP